MIELFELLVRGAVGSMSVVLWAQLRFREHVLNHQETHRVDCPDPW